MADRLEIFDQKCKELTPGTVLVREWDRRSHRVMVLAGGFAWNGQTYDSLTKVALAITGTRWNGPRFFGLRDKQANDLCILGASSQGANRNPDRQPVADSGHTHG